MSNPVFPLVATIAVQVLISMAAVTVPVFAPAAAGEIGISPGYVGLFVSLIYGGSTIASLVSGDLIQKFGAMRASQLCLLSCALGLALTTMGAPPLLAASAFLIGLGYGPVTPASSHILAKNTPPHLMSLVFSLKQTGVPIGGALAGAVVPPLVLWGGWRAAALTVAGACLATAVLAQPSRAAFDADRKPGHRLGVRSVGSSLRLVLGNAGIRRLAAMSFFFASLQLCLISYLVTYLTRNLGFSLIEAGLTLSVAQGAGIAGRVVWGAIAGRRMGPIRLLGLLGIAMSGCAGLTAAFSAHWPLGAIVAVSALFGATAIGWNGVYLAEVAKLSPEGRTADATGGALFFTYFGVFLGPSIFAMLVEHGFGYGQAFLLLGAPALAIGSRLLLLGPRAEPGVSSPSVRPPLSQE